MPATRAGASQRRARPADRTHHGRLDEPGTVLRPCPRERGVERLLGLRDGPVVGATTGVFGYELVRGNRARPATVAVRGAQPRRQHRAAERAHSLRPARAPSKPGLIIWKDCEPAPPARPVAEASRPSRRKGRRARPSAVTTGKPTQNPETPGLLGEAAKSGNSLQICRSREVEDQAPGARHQSAWPLPLPRRAAAAFDARLRVEPDTAERARRRARRRVGR
jgi:hypothetical protein